MERLTGPIAEVLATLDPLLLALGSLVALTTGVVVLFWLVGRWLPRHRRSSAEMALVRTGSGGAAAFVDGAGGWVWPAVHRLQPIALQGIAVVISARDRGALATGEGVRVDLEAHCHVRVRPRPTALAEAARALGRDAASPAAIARRVVPAGKHALATALAQEPWQTLHVQRERWLATAAQDLAARLLPWGLSLETLEVTHLAQGDEVHYRPFDLRDAQGLAFLTAQRAAVEGERAKGEAATQGAAAWLATWRQQLEEQLQQGVEAERERRQHQRRQAEFAHQREAWTAEAEAHRAKAEALAAREHLATVQAVAAAERQGQLARVEAVAAASTRARVQLVEAEATRRAAREWAEAHKVKAEAEAEAQRRLAKAAADEIERRAEAEARRLAVEAKGRGRLLKAFGDLPPEQLRAQASLLLIAQLPDILKAGEAWLERLQERPAKLADEGSTPETTALTLTVPFPAWLASEEIEAPNPNPRVPGAEHGDQS